MARARTVRLSSRRWSLKCFTQTQKSSGAKERHHNLQTKTSKYSVPEFRLIAVCAGNVTLVRSVAI